ncbi:hypothetical protein CRG98_010284 [Punica granatum]|uniref:KIB1-4 beta-propeller domain-containing protein n=1 Tax=Punica granatum TaxID=22663 RepID=A0A2I0KM08_PUNGR|nr:hypothetical protein CRG98_010284 [Punica granatum]
MNRIGRNYISAVLGEECSTIEQSANNWATLPRDLLLSILERLVPEVSDYIHFAAIENWIVNSRLHVPTNKRYCGSSHGWLIFPEEKLAITPFDPFSGATIHLPPVSRVSTEEEIRERGFFLDHEYEIPKVVLSADPHEAPDNYEVLAIHNDGNLALFSVDGAHGFT